MGGAEAVSSASGIKGSKMSTATHLANVDKTNFPYSQYCNNVHVCAVVLQHFLGGSMR
jgi:hypothetical protein